MIAANWPQYRGPNASGVDDSQQVPIEWNIENGNNIAWQTPIPGLAHAAPIIWSNRVYVATAVKPGAVALKIGLYGDIDSVQDRDPNEWRLLALDRHTGAVVWNQLAHSGIPRVKRHTKATHCNSTPATDGQRIVALFGSEGLWCFDLQGNVQWKRDLGPMDSGYFASPSAQWGFASSPILYESKVIVQCDVQTNSFVAVFDATDGREVWRTTRNDVPTWSTPTVVVAHGRTQVAINGWHHTGGYDFKTGAELWKLKGGGDIPVPTPVFAHDLIFFTSAHGSWRPIRAIRPTASGDITPKDPGQTNSSIVWTHGRQGAYMQTPIVVGDLLWSCTDNGVLTCFDAATGAIRYSERLASRGGQGYTASPVSDGRNLYFTSEEGNVFVVPAKAQFAVLTFNSLGETCLATPALSDGTLYFRTRSKLIAVRSKP
jgi:outer membrane protein assembly factor BamB